ncbi:MAG TPA: hypothetical protein VLT16_01290 [Candidatus Limnocylindrales bacterium]|nr:hypothetical protein [Candidatus Limnocylindrales bacterium]
MMNGKRRNQQRGSALLLVMIALLLLLAVAFVMVYSTITETRIDANFGLHKQSYYASRAGLEEVRDRMRYPSTSPTAAGGLSDLLPKDIPGNPNGVMYVLNPAAAEVIDPTNPASKYFDVELCHAYDPAALPGQKCSTVPVTAGWELPSQTSIQAAAGQPLAYKWVRINFKTNRVSSPFCVDGACNAATLDNRICWNGQNEVPGPDLTTRCKDLNMHQVYMLTSFSSSFGAKSLTRYEIAKDSIRPPGALTLESANAAPAFNNGSQGTGVSIPPTNIDGRPRDINGNLLPPGNGCAAVSSLATDSTKSTTDLQGALDTLRNNIVQRANDFCNADGSNATGKTCTPGLWWVRGTDPTPRFNQSNCAPSDAGCYKNLDLSAPQLDAVSAVFAPHVPAVVLPPQNPSAPFVGAPGNVDPLIAQINQNLLQQEINNILQVVSDSVGQPNYVTVPGSNITSDTNFGSPTNPQIVVATATGGLEIQNGVTVNGYGILVIPNTFLIDAATFNWTGIVLVQAPSGEIRLNTGATGSINGSLLLQADANGTANVRTSDSDSSKFTISYSCDAIDLAFRTAPLKIISYSEVGY